MGGWSGWEGTTHLPPCPPTQEGGGVKGVVGERGVGNGDWAKGGVVGFYGISALGLETPKRRPGGTQEALGGTHEG